jgi:hypothetical protein
MIDIDTIEEYAKDASDKYNNVDYKRYDNNRVEVNIKDQSITVVLKADSNNNEVAVDIEESNHSFEALILDNEEHLEYFLLNKIKRYM